MTLRVRFRDLYFPGDKPFIVFWAQKVIVKGKSKEMALWIGER